MIDRTHSKLAPQAQDRAAFGSDTDPAQPPESGGDRADQTAPAKPAKKRRKPKAADRGDAGDTAPEQASNAQMAKLFARDFADIIRFNHDTRSWMSFRGTRWTPDRCGETQHTLADFCHANGRGDAKFIRETEFLARNRPEFRVTSDAFDKDDWLLGTPAGYVNLRTGDIALSGTSRLVTKLTAVGPSYDPPQRWLQFLRQVHGGDQAMVEFIQRFHGYALTGDTSEQALLLIPGAAGTGKSTQEQTIAGVLGDYHKAGNPGALLTSRNADPERPQSFLVALDGARFVTLPETKSTHVLDAPVVARLTGGDKQSVRDLHQKAREFVPKCKGVLYGNQLPSISGSTAAMARRLLVAPMNVVFKGAVGSRTKHDPQLMERLRGEWPQILGWLIEGCLKWQTDGLKVPPAVIAASREFISDADPVSTWMNSALLQDPTGELTNAQAWDSWQEWAKRHGHLTGTERFLGARLSELLGRAKVGAIYGKKGTRKTYRFRYGWRLQ